MTPPIAQITSYISKLFFVFLSPFSIFGTFNITFLGTQQDEEAALHEPVDDNPDR